MTECGYLTFYSFYYISVVFLNILIRTTCRTEDLLYTEEII